MATTFSTIITSAGVKLQLLSVRLAVRVPVVHVLGIRARVREAFQTLGALEWFFPGVQTFVLGQVVFVFERFAAHVTFVRSLTCNTQPITPNVTL